MRSAVLQFLLAGALVVAWIWMLGRPLLGMLARRSRRDSVGHFRSQQAALGRSVGIEPSARWTATAFRPIADWRAQPLEQRRLQLLLAGAIAAFAAALLAIALRGVYVRLFLVMLLGFAAHVLVAAWIGSRELRFQEAELRRRTIEAATERSAGRRSVSRPVEAQDHGHDEDLGDDLLAGEGMGGGLFDDGFFEPIPELEIRPERPSPQPAAAEEQVAEPAASDEPTFTSPVTARPRPRPGRPAKGRPIYVEPEPGEGDETVRAVND